ncbi:MAG: hypothetical protein ACYDDF_04285 [Thermoplasmatota archaeon]
MVFLEKTIEIACAPSRAFALLAEPAVGWQGWSDETVTPHPGALSDGERITLTQRLLGIPLSSLSEVHIRPEHAIHFEQVEGDFASLEGVFDVSRGPRGSRVRALLRAELPFVMPMLVTERQVIDALSNRLDSALFALQERLEERRETSTRRPSPVWPGRPRLTSSQKPTGFAEV